jgi:hypothetical protein
VSAPGECPAAPEPAVGDTWIHAGCRYVIYAIKAAGECVTCQDGDIDPVDRFPHSGEGCCWTKVDVFKESGRLISRAAPAPQPAPVTVKFCVCGMWEGAVCSFHATAPDSTEFQPRPEYLDKIKRAAPAVQSGPVAQGMCVSGNCATMNRAPHEAHEPGLLPKSLDHFAHCLYCFHALHGGPCPTAVQTTPPPAERLTAGPASRYAQGSLHANHRHFHHGCAECLATNGVLIPQSLLDKAAPVAVKPLPPMQAHTCRHDSYREFCPRCIDEAGPGIASKVLPPAKYRFVPRIDYWDLLPGADERGWRS